MDTLMGLAGLLVISGNVELISGPTWHNLTTTQDRDLNNNFPTKAN